MTQVPFSISALLLFPVPMHHSGILLSILRPIVRVSRPPLAGTVPADLPVLGIGRQLALPVLAPPLPLTRGLAANGLAQLILRGLKRVLAKAAAPVIHTRRCRTKGTPFLGILMALPRGFGKHPGWLTLYGDWRKRTIPSGEKRNYVP